MGRYRSVGLAPGRTFLILLISVALAASCESAPTQGAPEALLEPLVVTSLVPGQLLIGTRVRILGSGFVSESLGEQQVRLSGLLNQEITVPAAFIDEHTLEFIVDAALIGQFDIDGGYKEATVEVVRTPSRGGDITVASCQSQLRAVSQLTPTLSDASPEDVHPGAVLHLGGEGFLQLSEGTSVVVFDGDFTTSDPPMERVIAGLPVPGETRDRKELTVALTPDIFGIRPGVFRGRLRVINQHPGAPDAESAELSGVFLRYKAAEIESVEPSTVRRGQRVFAHGRGFIATDTALETTTLIVLDGSFQTLSGETIDYTGEHALTLYPDSFGSGVWMEHVLRVGVNPYGELEGLGLIPGDFTGTVAPLLVYGQDRVFGVGREVQLTIGPQLQIVQISYLASFDDALDRFGMRAVSDRVRARILEVCARDYAGVSIRFQEDPPQDFVDYSVVEVLGSDPNGVGLLGLDNTAGKDVGNLRFNDFIGGVNAETGESGYYPFGGVFAESLLQFSPTVGAAMSTGGGAESGEAGMASARFDDIFGPFVPELGGEPIGPDDLNGGSRAADIDEAVRVLGNLIGTTVTHEVGHSLGLAAVEGNFHNIGDEPNRIMDAGQFRPFEERAELDGQGPAVFAPHNRAYLETILPVY